jgi:hypothetical protein
VGIAKRGHLRILVVLLASKNLPFDAGEALLDWAFAKESSLTGRTG